jgi:Mg-chelatase subunit ChlD
MTAVFFVMRFDVASPERIAIVFLIDITKALSRQQFAMVKDAVRAWIAWIESLGPTDRAAIVTFGSSVNTIQDFTADKRALNLALDGLAPIDMRTSLYRGLVQAIDLSRRLDSSLPLRRAIVVLTDGMDDDQQSGGGRQEVLDKLAVDPVPIYGLGASSQYNAKVDAALEDFAGLVRASGGDYNRIELGSLNKVYERLRAIVSSTKHLIAECHTCALDGSAIAVQLLMSQEATRLSSERVRVRSVGADGEAAPPKVISPAPPPQESGPPPEKVVRPTLPPPRAPPITSTESTRVHVKRAAQDEIALERAGERARSAFSSLEKLRAITVNPEPIQNAIQEEENVYNSAIHDREALLDDYMAEVEWLGEHDAGAVDAALQLESESVATPSLDQGKAAAKAEMGRAIKLLASHVRAQRQNQLKREKVIADASGKWPEEIPLPNSPAKDSGAPPEKIVPQNPPPTSNASANALSPLDDALEKLVARNITFNAPDSMSMGKSKVIEAKLSANLPPNDLLVQLREAGKEEWAGLSVAGRMNAALSSGGAFEVTPSGSQQQPISHPTWTWEVTPKEAGTHLLFLSLQAIFTIDGRDETRPITMLKRPVGVQVGWLEWLDWFKNLFVQLSWLWGTILLPVGYWIWARFRKKPPPGGGSAAPPAVDKFASTC